MFSTKFLIFIASTLSTVIFLFIIRGLCLKFDIIPKSSFRRPDQKPVALLGGLGIYLGAALANIILNSTSVWHILIAALPLLILGALDDVYELRARTKIIGQLTSIVLWIGLVTPKDLFFSQMGMPPLVGAMVAGIFLLAMINAFNFLDGIDGQVGVMALAGVLALGMGHGPFEDSAILFSGAIIGFLYLNFPPAQIYLGEVGSSFLGFALGCMATLVPVDGHPWIRFWAINFICSFAFCDLLFSFGRRIIRGLAPWSPDRDHFHHKMLRLGFNSKGALIISSIIIAFSNIAGSYLLQAESPADAYMFMLTAGGLLTTIYVGLLYFELHIANRVSLFGRTILEKVFNFDTNRTTVDAQSPVLVFDFLLYYTDLQKQGIRTVEEFVKKVDYLVEVMPFKKSIKLVGSYTIVVIFEPQAKGYFDKGSEIPEMFKHVLMEFKVLKRLEKIPEGLFLYKSMTRDARQILGDQIEIVQDLKSA